MSGAELAARMGVGQSTVAEMERREVDDTVRLDTLRRAADALDCDLVYVFIPRTTLDEAVRAQARRKAARLLGPVAHHSRLEDQVVDPADAEAQIDELAAGFIDKRGLWSDREPT
jgi:predicted DNA-binding mobile mystery protein A